MQNLLVLSVIAATVAPFCFMQVGAVKIRVGLYNSIPDLAGDGLQSYKELVERGHQYTVEAVVDEKEYDPYGDLEEYLANFDLLEIDTATLAGVVEKGLVKKVDDIPGNILPAAVEAVKVNGDTYGYPTLACGNFLIGLNPGSDETCSLRIARMDFDSLFDSLTECSDVFVSPIYGYRRLLGGKMYDDWGWYLPFIYLDGYIDRHGPFSVAKGVSEVTQGIVDEELCFRLSWFIDRCSHKGKNKCYDEDVKGNYIENKQRVYKDIAADKTLFFFGFSEKLSEVIQNSEGQKNSYEIISSPLGEESYLMQFTDALVISEARWQAADEQKRNAIRDFIRFFTSTEFRYDFVMGKDLNPQRIRFLLPPNEDFYTATDARYNFIYNDLYWALRRAVPAPSLDDDTKAKMQAVLAEKCVKIASAKAQKTHEEL